MKKWLTVVARAVLQGGPKEVAARILLALVALLSGEAAEPLRRFSELW